MYWLKWLYPGLNIKRWLFLLLACALLVAGGLIVACAVYWEGAFGFLPPAVAAHTHKLLAACALAVAAGCYAGVFAVSGLLNSLAYVLPGEEGGSFIDLLFLKRKLRKGAAITIIGGGSGLSTLLRGLKHVSGNCRAVVAVTDDGGSSGLLREEFGIIPTGDLRACITALADTEPLMSNLMQYRFKEGTSLSGHSFGNLFITAMADVTGDMEKGLSATNNILKVRGSVLPASLASVNLAAQLSDGRVIVGETNIVAAGQKIKRLMLSPAEPTATDSAVEAIRNAELLVVGPGSLYSSIITNLLIPGIREAVLNSRAIKVYICNVMTQPGETDGYTAYDHVRAIYDHVGARFFDFIVVNKQEVAPELLSRYAQKGSYPVKGVSGKLRALGAAVVEASLISKENIIRHDPLQLTKTVIGLLYRLRLSRNGNRVLDYYFVKDSLKRARKALRGK